MAKEAQTMINELYSFFKETYTEPIKSWDNMLEFIASYHNPTLLLEKQIKPEWINRDDNFSKKIIEIYDPTILTNNIYDDLGDYYYNNIILKKRIDLPNVENKISDLLSNINDEDKNLNNLVLDKQVGTGKNLLEIAKRCPHWTYFGVDNDIRHLRIAMTNFYIHNISGYLLHADPQIHDIELITKEGRYNWKYANNWESQIHNLKNKIKNEYINKPKI